MLYSRRSASRGEGDVARAIASALDRRTAHAAASAQGAPRGLRGAAGEAEGSQKVGRKPATGSKADHMDCHGHSQGRLRRARGSRPL